MTIDSATAVELVDMVALVLILAVAIYAQRKFRFVVFKLGWDIIAASGAIRIAGSLFRAYFLNKHTPEAVSPLSSMVAMMAITAEKCTRIFKKGEMEELITKADGGVLLTERCGEFIFIVAVDKGVDLDAIKPQRERVKEAIEGMV